MTPTTIHKLPTTGKRYEANDKAKTGLIVRIGTSGSKSWGFRSRIKTGIKGRSPTFRDSFGFVIQGVDGKPDRQNIIKAKAWAVALKALTDAGIDPRDQRRENAEAPTIDTIWGRYRNGRRSQKKAPSSQRGDERTWRLHIAPRFSGMKISSITTPLISDFYDDKKIAGRNANQIMALLSVIMSEGVREGTLKYNPCREVPREKESRITWERLETHKQRLALMKAAYDYNEMAGLLVEIALLTGARKKEILNARWEHITPLEDGTALWVIPETKQKRAHRVNIPKSYYERLKKRQSDGVVTHLSGWVFPSPVKQGAALEDTKSFFNKVRTCIGKPKLRFHDLRHDFGTQLAIAGEPATNIMAAMGHNSLQTTLRYIDIATAELASKASTQRELAIMEAKERQTNDYRI